MQVLIRDAVCSGRSSGIGIFGAGQIVKSGDKPFLGNIRIACSRIRFDTMRHLMSVYALFIYPLYTDLPSSQLLGFMLKMLLRDYEYPSSQASLTYFKTQHR